MEDESRFADEVAAKSFELDPVQDRGFTQCAAKSLDANCRSQRSVAKKFCIPTDTS